MELVQALILGALQGIFEWLPVSSEGVLTLTMTQILGEEALESVNAAVWLHLGTVLAALVYFRDNFREIIEEIPDYFFRREGADTSKINFVFLATVASSALGGVIYLFGLTELVKFPRVFTGVMGGALLGTGLMRFYTSKSNRKINDVNWKDSGLVGALQGLSIVPGVSRSGSTVFGLLYRDFDGKDAFKLSFILSVPAILIANVGIELFSGFQVSGSLILGALTAFAVGYLAIDVVLRIAGELEVAYLCFILAALSFASIFLL